MDKFSVSNDPRGWIKKAPFIRNLSGLKNDNELTQYYGGKGVSEHFRITHNSIVLSPQTIKMVVISPRIIQTK